MRLSALSLAIIVTGSLRGVRANECGLSDDTALTATCQCGSTECTTGQYCVTGANCLDFPSDCGELETLWNTGINGVPCCSETDDCKTYSDIYNNAEYRQTGSCCTG